MNKKKMIELLVDNDIHCAMDPEYGRDFLKEVFTKGVDGYNKWSKALLKEECLGRGLFD